MKKMKFCKLSRVLISISLLAIIAVSLISVPVSAADRDSYIGEWYINDFTGSGSASMDWDNGVSGYFNYAVSSTEVKVIPFNSLACYVSTSNNMVIRLSLQGSDSGNVETLIKGNEVVSGKDGNTTTFREGSEIYTSLRTFVITTEPTNASFKTFLDTHGTFIEPPVEPSLLDNILGTFSEVGSWIGTIISSLVALFWSVETASLTFLGILSVAGLAFSVIMLLFGFVTRFVGFSG